MQEFYGVPPRAGRAKHFRLRVQNCVEIERRQNVVIVFISSVEPSLSQCTIGLCLFYGLHLNNLYFGYSYGISLVYFAIICFFFPFLMLTFFCCITNILASQQLKTFSSSTFSAMAFLCSCFNLCRHNIKLCFYTFYTLL